LNSPLPVCSSKSFVPKNGTCHALANSGWKNFVNQSFQIFSSLL
jgi:hypothetical protein